MDNIELGDQVKDVVSGWEGLATARYDYLNGCVRWEIAGADKDGKPDSYVFDQQQIQIMEKGRFKEPNSIMTGVIGKRQRSTGGPRDNAPIPRS